jgi:hypothetical protein
MGFFSLLQVSSMASLRVPDDLWQKHPGLHQGVFVSGIN